MQEKVSKAVAMAETHLDNISDGALSDRVQALTRHERNQFIAALCFKLPLGYAIVPRFSPA
jgi:hypothetical protein